MDKLTLDRQLRSQSGRPPANGSYEDGQQAKHRSRSDRGYDDAREAAPISGDRSREHRHNHQEGEQRYGDRGGSRRDRHSSRGEEEEQRPSSRRHRDEGRYQAVSDDADGDMHGSGRERGHRDRSDRRDRYCTALVSQSGLLLGIPK